MREERLEKAGIIAHYYAKIGVAVVNVTAPLNVEDKIRIKGSTTDFEQTLGSMEIEHKKIENARQGDSVGIKVKERVRESDIVYKKIL
jgi:putative protease